MLNNQNYQKGGGATVKEKTKTLTKQPIEGILNFFQQEVNNLIKNCGYYFKMSHLITILKCHIGKISSRKNYWRIGDEKSMDYGGRNEKV